MAENLDHVLDEPAGVVIMTGETNRPRDGAHVYRAKDNWLFLSLRNGSLLLDNGNRRRRIPAPSLLCLQPGDPTTITMPPNAIVHRLLIAICWTPRSRAGRRGLVLTGRRQPRAEEWFGCTLPLEVEASLREAGMRVIERGCREWWRSPMRRLRAAADIQVWLYRWVDEHLTADPDRRTFWDHLTDHVRSHLVEGIQVGDIADRLGLTRSGLYRRMRRELRTTPKAWLDEIRLDLATHLLEDGSNRSLDGVARLCGFADRSSFSHWFTRQRDCAPDVWRHRQRR